MRRVIIESPLAGDRELNRAYAKRCMQDSLARGEAPYASHLLFDQPGLLDDDNPGQRELGMRAGFAWAVAAELIAVYTDRGISAGMLAGIAVHKHNGTPIQYRSLNTACV